MNTIRSLAAVAVCLSAGLAKADLSVIRSGFDSNTLARNDDGSTGLVSLGFTANFFGIQNTQAYVNNNGNITFDSPLGAFTPFDLNSTNRQIIAPFFADVDTRGTSNGSLPVTYGIGTVDGRAAFGVNWLNVGYFSGQTNKLNSFQLLLIDRSDTGAGNFDFEFNYGSIQWETGDFSGGTNGLGGSSARAGYSNGTGAAGTFFELQGSAVNGAFLNNGPNALASGGNVGPNLPGRFMFNARNGGVVVTLPEPTSMGMLGTGMVMLVAGRRVRRVLAR